MFAVFQIARKATSSMTRTGRLALAGSLLWLAACDAVPMGSVGGGGGPSIDPSAPVPVALLIPRSDPGAAPVARSLENAARLAIANLQGARIDLRVYDTGGNPAQAAAQAQKAVDDGAKIILGPLFAESANAAGIAVADEGINVLSFSNNASIAGGNVFVLGPTFMNTANRLMGYAARQGKRSIVIMSSPDASGSLGRNAIQRAASNNGIQVAASQQYPLTIEGITATGRDVQSILQQTGADSVFMTADATSAALPTLLEAMASGGVNPATTQYVGLTRWDVQPALFSFPGAQGGWFAIPNQAAQNSFESRYRAAYGAAPHPLAGLSFDGIAAIGALVGRGDRNALTGQALTQSSGFQGTSGVFRLRPDGSNERGLAVATVRNNQVVILDPAPSAFGGAGF